MRNIATVIDGIVATIPEQGYDEMRQSLATLKGEVEKTPPQAMRLRWTQLGEVLNDSIVNPIDAEWKVNAISVFLGQPAEVIAQHHAVPDVAKLFLPPVDGHSF